MAGKCFLALDISLDNYIYYNFFKLFVMRKMHFLVLLVISYKSLKIY